MVKQSQPTSERMTVDYCRISYDKSGAALGVEAQHLDNLESASELSVTIRASYQDNNTSAYTGELRPEYQRLLTDIKSGLIDLVIIWHANRLHRSLEEAILFVKVAREFNTRLYSHSKGSFYNLQRSAGRREFLGDTLKAEGESEERGERIALARKRQARQGAYGGGIRPYGWGLDTGRVRSVCVNPKAPPMERRYEYRPVLDMTKHNPVEAAEIRKWARMILAGISMNEILRDLETRGVPTSGQTDGREVVRADGTRGKIQGWASTSIRSALLNARTVGHSVYKGEIVAKNVFPPILTAEVQEALRTILNDPKRNTNPGNPPRWLGSLIYECTTCDDGTIMWVTGNKSGTPIYRCKKASHCAQPAPLIDKFVESVLIERISRLDIASLVARENRTDLAALREELTVLEERNNDAALSFAQGNISRSQLETITAATNSRINAVNAELKKAVDDNPLSQFVNTKNVAKRWGELSLAQKRAILRLLAEVKLKPIGRGKGRSPHPMTARLEIRPKSI